MAELDFDELDKAVNDLMANVNTSQRTPGDDPEDKVVTIPDSGQSAPEPSVTAAPTPSATAPATPAAPVTPPLATKRRGQFMDIVHPSQDMNPKPKAPSRQGVTIEPMTTPTSASSAPQRAPQEESSAPAEVTPRSAAPMTMPDPIDMAAANETSTLPVASDEIVTPPATTEVTSSSNEDDAEPAPLNSPFLPDTKVEKRPLGGAVAGDTETPVSGTQTPPQAPTEPVVLPEELKGDVMAVESKDLTGHTGQETEVAEVPATAEPAAPAPKPEATPSATPEVGPTSITQQYAEQPSSGDQSNGSIYDTSTYHQAIEGEKPAKKSSAIVWIIWLLILLLVGVAGGAAYFYFTR